MILSKIWRIAAAFHKVTKKEIEVLDFINRHFQNGVSDTVMPIVTRLGSYGFVWIAICICLLLNKKYRRDGLILAVALIISLLIGNITIKPLVRRTRPYDVNTAFKLLIPRQTDFSFPSGHSMSSFAAATVLMYTNIKFGIPALILAALIAFSRLYLYVHFPSDVVGGILLGVFTGCLSVKKFSKKKAI